jgi:predicted transcriptional regulator of viral defense system
MADEAHVGAALPTERAPRRADDAIAVVASRQHGVISRAQLVEFGLGPGAIKHRISLGRLHPLHRGVYTVGHRALRREAWWLAAVLAAGPGAALSYRSAAELWGMRNGSRARVEVSVPRHRRSTARIEVHVVEMRPDEITVHDGIPVTTPARTLLDLAAVVSPQHLKAAFEEAEVRRLTSPTSLDALVARHQKRRGTATIKRILQEHHDRGQSIPTSILERRFLALLDAHGLPRPEINHLSDNGELDATWHEQRLVVECDSFATHGTREAFERDRAKDRALQAAGWRVIRVTWRQLIDDADVVGKQLAALLAGRS